MRLLPLLALAACTPEYEEQCPTETHVLERACDDASVIGTHENKELYKAVDDLRSCIGYDVRILCSDDGDQKILTVERR